jgi:hypothetical protein
VGTRKTVRSAPIFHARFLIGYAWKAAWLNNRFGIGADVNLVFTKPVFPQKPVERLLIAPSLLSRWACHDPSGQAP